MAKKKTIKGKYPNDCPHKNFFGCKHTRDCATCYYNPDITQKPWFYDDPADAKKSLSTLDDIRCGRGLRPGGKRFPWKYVRKKKNDSYDEE